MQANETLREILENLGDTYTESSVGGDGISIEFDDQPRISEDGSTIYVNPEFADMLDLDVSAGNEFRLIRNTLNHETAHDRWSKLTAKKDFAAKYDEYARLAANVLNILEDAYIDSRRLGEYPGLRKAQAFFAESQIKRDVNDKRGKASALALCVHQLALTGRVNGIQNADDDVREFAAWVLPRIERVRRTHDEDDREAIAAEVVDHIIDLLPPRPDFSDLDDLLDDLADADGDIKPDEVEDVDPSDVDADDAPTDDLPDLDELDASEEDNDESGEAGDADVDAEGEDEEGDEEGNAGDASLDDFEDEDASDMSSDEAGGASNEEGENDEDEVEEGDDAGGNDDLDDLLDDLDERDEEGENPEWYDAEDDYDEASKSDERRAQRVRENAVKDESPIGERKRERDERLSTRSHSIRVPYDEVRDEVERSGLADDIRKAFEKFATEDMTRRDTSGESLNMRAATRHKAGDYSERRVYETEYTAASGGRTVAVTLDGSSSMATSKMREGKKALAALAEATDAIGDDFLATGYTSESNNTGLIAPLITAPNETFEYEQLDAIGCENHTPTPPAIADIADLLRDARGKELVLICITDGMPNVMLDGSSESHDEDAKDDVRAKVEELRSQGIHVIGINIAGEGYEPEFAHMFGENGFITSSSDTLVDDLVSVYEEQLDVRRPAF
jgi:Mg-chelatase subunit ChlD